MIDFLKPNRRQLLGGAAAAGASLIAPPGLITSARAASAPLPAVKEEDALIAFGHTGPVADEGWTWSHDQGMKAVQAAFPKLKTAMVESIPYSATPRARSNNSSRRAPTWCLRPPTTATFSMM